MSDQSREIQPVPWNVADVAIATALVFGGFFAVLVALEMLAGDNNVEEQSALAPWLTATLEGLMLAVVWVFAIRKHRVSWGAVGLRPPQGRGTFVLPWVVLAGSLAFTALYSFVVTELGLDILEPPPLPDELLGEGIVRFLNIAVIALWGPFAEEVFFRGFLLAALLTPLGAARGAMASAAVFSLAHLSIGTLIPIFVTGLLLAWLYLKTRSLWPAVIAHAAQNFLAVSFAGAAEPGGAEEVGVAAIALISGIGG